MTIDSAQKASKVDHNELKVVRPFHIRSFTYYMTGIRHRHRWQRHHPPQSRSLRRLRLLRIRCACHRLRCATGAEKRALVGQGRGLRPVVVMERLTIELNESSGRRRRRTEPQVRVVSDTVLCLMCI